MKTIEERLGLCKRCLTDTDRYCHKECYLYSKYQGAIEQQKIDDEEQGKALLYAVHKTAERTKKEVIAKACGALDDVYFPSEESREKAKQIVRKAMEEI